ncbi:MAG: calcium-binding protein [Inquilinus sp.]|uniref:calcium-binding protein n=1 Tax=Inquilinus sp. TaxID=1932117 RepID=UPI003F2D88D6
MAIITGDDNPNRLFGTSEGDTINGFGGDDSLSGLGGNDVLQGGTGADALAGGDGLDAASYADSAAGVRVDLLSGTAAGGDATGDSLVSIENLIGSNYGDELIGQSSSTLMGDSGDDILRGGNLLSGGGGDDILSGGAGADLLGGDGGSDIASYYTALTGVAVNLATGAASGGDAAGDTLFSIEGLSGSNLGNDSLAGDAGANVLRGWGGDDALTGAGGKDTLIGGAGADRFVYGSTADSAVGANADVIGDFSHAQGDRIDLSAIDANTSAAGDQAFTFIGTATYTGVAGQLRYHSDGVVTTIAGDVNGDGVSDFHIQLTGAIGVASGDFVL